MNKENPTPEQTILPASIEIPLSPESNPLNECGVICLQMILEHDKKTPILLEDLRARLDKPLEEGVDPGRLCKVLKEEGYDVHYHTSVDVETIANNNPESDFHKWDEKIQNVVALYKGSTLEVNVDKLHTSAQWLVSEENKDIVVKKNLSLLNIARLLGEDKRIIALVKNAAHFVVIVGIDASHVYFNDPQAGGTIRESKTHEEFLAYWSSQPDARDAIVASDINQ